ncbi:hypothetical protein D3C81_1431380 [compost metagenome]
MGDPVVQATQQRAADAHQIAELVGEAAAGLVAVLGRREERTEEQQETVRVLVIAADGLGHQFQRVAADLLHRTAAVQYVTVAPFDAQVDLAATHVIQAEAIVEQADEGADGAGAVVVLGLAQQEGAAPFDIAQVDVVAQGRPQHLATAVDGQDDLGLRVVPGGRWQQAHLRAAAHRRHRLRLGKHFRIGADAHFHVL